MIKIRKAKPEDAESINKVFFNTWLSTYPNPELGITKEDIEEFYKDTLSKSGILKLSERISNLPEHIKIIVAEINGIIVGVCRIIIKDNYNQLQAIYILSEYQNKGLGKKMWLECVKLFDHNKKIIVQVADYNKNAIDFYKTIGFVEVSEITNHTEFKMPISGVVIREIQLEIKNNSIDELL